MKTVLVTGASKGVGYALAIKFLEEGFKVVCTSRDKQDLQTLNNKYGNLCHPYSLDLRSSESIDTFFLNVSGQKFDIVIQNAGSLVNKPFLKISKEELYACYEVNVLGPFQLQQKLFPLLNKDSHTVFISSVGGFQGSVKFPGLSAYSTSKAAIVSLTELLQEEFKESNLVFNCLCLGAVQTEMLDNAFPGYKAPLNAPQMAAYIFQFATTAHHYMRGKVLPVSLTTP